jgi:hypothetical protein
MASSDNLKAVPRYETIVLKNSGVERRLELLERLLKGEELECKTKDGSWAPLSISVPQGPGAIMVPHVGTSDVSIPFPLEMLLNYEWRVKVKLRLVGSADGK